MVDKPRPATLYLAAVAEWRCCSQKGDETIEVVVPADGGGRGLATLRCDQCGSEYLLGLIAKTREESLASEVFEELTADEEEAIGIDRSDKSEPPDEIRMCAKCDGTASASELCGGCREYVHEACRTRQPARSVKHQAEEHWEAPKFAPVKTVVVEADDDGSRMDGDDAFRVEE